MYQKFTILLIILATACNPSKNTQGDKAEADPESSAAVDDNSLEEAKLAAEHEEEEREEARKKAEEEAEAEAKRKAEEEALAARRAGLEHLLGVKESKTAASGDVTFTVTSKKLTKKWIFDRHRTSYYLRDADRGTKFVALDLAVSSKDKDPTLPELFACWFEPDARAYCIAMTLKFSRWDNYGSYLGNYSDTGNDFAKRETVKFTTAVMMDEDLLEKPFVVVAKPNCNRREYDRWGRPPVRYVSKCDAPNDVEDMVDLPVVHVLNKKALVSTLEAALANAG